MDDLQPTMLQFSLMSMWKTQLVMSVMLGPLSNPNQVVDGNHLTLECSSSTNALIF
eukprot:m.45292 g.45292  ORF g.45292 m.45292 type:complete len:56 (+) comp10227_c0_seq2:1646-1813(+)